MTIFLVSLLVLMALLVGYVVGTLLSRRAAEQARAEAAAAVAALESERRHSAQAAEKQAQALRTEFRAMASDLAEREGRALRTEHLHSLDALLAPLGKDIAHFREQFLKGHADLDRHIRDLVEQTSAVGREAEELTRALRGNTKLQGNWGEAVLSNLLDAAGLTEGRDYTVQQRTKDEEGRDLIPDVIVHLPGGRAVVVDSKVSLNAYTDFVTAQNETTEESIIAQREALQAHVASVRRHIKELSAKNYNKAVKGSIGYVLMFIPGEAAYVAAVSAEPSLATEAYSRRVILINPTNLLMALQLAHNLWQSELQSRSVSEIYASAERLYKKFSLFAKNFVQIGTSIRQLSATYESAEKQLATGRGNIVSQLEGWKKKGLTPTTDIPQALKEEEESGELSVER